MRLFQREPGRVVLVAKTKRAMECSDYVYHVFVGRRQIVGAVVRESCGNYQARYADGTLGPRNPVIENAINDLILHSLHIEYWTQ